MMNGKILIWSPRLCREKNNNNKDNKDKKKKAKKSLNARLSAALAKSGPLVFPTVKKFSFIFFP